MQEQSLTVQQRKELRVKTSGAIDLLVDQGRAERVVIDGKPGVRLIRPEDRKE